MSVISTEESFVKDVVFNNRQYQFYRLDHILDSSQSMFYSYYDNHFMDSYFELKSISERPVFISVKVGTQNIDMFLKDLRLLYNDTINVVPEHLDIETFDKIFHAIIRDPNISVNVYLVNVLLFKFRQDNAIFSREEAFYCNSECIYRKIKNCRWNYIETLLYPFSKEQDIHGGKVNLCRMINVFSMELSNIIAGLYKDPIGSYIRKRLERQTLLPVVGYLDPYGIFE
jgi:hypothetical protein